MKGQAPIGEDDLQGYVDGRLPPERMAAVDAYLEAYPEATARIRQHVDQRSALRAMLQAKGDEPIPARLRIANIEAQRRLRWSNRLRRVAAAGLWLLVGATGGWVAATQLSPDSVPTAGGMAERFAGEALRAHRVFVPEVRHPVEVEAGQEAHLVQWLSKRLGHPLQVPNLSRQGYQLMGGRLLPAAEGPAALLMYSDAAGQRLTVYLTVTEGAETSFRYVQQGDTGGFYWRDGAFSYAVVAQADRQRLLSAAEAIYHQTAGEP